MAPRHVTSGPHSLPVRTAGAERHISQPTAVHDVFLRLAQQHVYHYGETHRARHGFQLGNRSDLGYRARQSRVESRPEWAEEGGARGDRGDGEGGVEGCGEGGRGGR